MVLPHTQLEEHFQCKCADPRVLLWRWPIVNMVAGIVHSPINQRGSETELEGFKINLQMHDTQMDMDIGDRR